MDLLINGVSLVGFSESPNDIEYLKTLGYSDSQITAAFDEAKACLEQSLPQASA